MRIVIGSLQQESNDMCVVQTTKEDFDIAIGSDMLKKVHVAGILEEARAEVICTLYAHAVPCGRVRKQDYLDIVNQMVDGIPADGIDGIWLYLHGSMCVQEIGSGEEYLLRRIRDKVGYSIPIACAMDFHANNTDNITDLANIICGYRTAPHRDMEETEQKAMKILLYCIEKKILPKPVISRANMILCADTVQTDTPPLSSIMAAADEMEKLPGMLAVNVFGAQVWVDEPYAGPNFVVIHEFDQEIAKECADKLAKMYWDARYDFVYSMEAAEPDKAVEAAMADGGQVYLSDAGDNTTAGSPGDNAFILNRLIEHRAKKAVIGGITDKPAVEKCYAAGLGADIELKIGATIDPRSEVANIKGKVSYIGDIVGWYGENGGPAAVIETGDITVVITAYRNCFIRPSMFSSVGINVDDYNIVVVKTGYLYPENAAAAKRAILMFTPGSSPQRLQQMGFTKIRRPMYPLEDNFMG